MAPPLMLPIRSGPTVAVRRMDWSSDGRYLAYRVKTSGVDSLFAVDMTGEMPASELQLGSSRTALDLVELYFAWSPAASDLAFIDPGTVGASPGIGGAGPVESVPPHLALARVAVEDTPIIDLSGALSVSESDVFSWSPNGAQIALRRASQGDLQVVDATGASAPLSVGTGLGAITEFVWSPQGDTLAYCTQDGQGIWLVRVEDRSGRLGVTVEVLAEAPAEGSYRGLTWLPDGSGLLAMVAATMPSEDGKTGEALADAVWLDLEGALPSVPVLLPGHGSVGRIEAKGSRILFSANNAIWMLDRDALDQSALGSVDAERIPAHQDPTTSAPLAYDTRWDLSEDGDRVLFVGNLDRWDLPEIYHLDLTDSGAVPMRIAYLPEAAEVVDLRFGGSNDEYAAYRIRPWRTSRACLSVSGEPVPAMCETGYSCDAELGICKRPDPLALFVLRFTDGVATSAPLTMHQPELYPQDPAKPSPFEPLEYAFRPRP